MIGAGVATSWAHGWRCLGSSLAVRFAGCLAICLLLFPRAVLGIPVASQCKPLSLGVPIADTLSTTDQVNCFTFAANAGDVIVVRMASSWNYSPRVELWGPTGLVKAGVDTRFVEISAALPSSGTYTVMAMDQEGNDTGPYGLFVQNVTHPESAPAFPLGQTVPDTLQFWGWVDNHTVTADSGAVIVVRMASSWNYSPRVELWGPTGLVKAGVDTRFVEISAALPSSGTYTVMAMDQEGNDTGAYTSFVWCSGCPICDCSHQGDCKSDGIINPVDVVLLINYAFIGGPPPPADASCPCLNRGDWDCNARVDMGDIVKMVNHVYRGGPRPVDPCGE